MKEGISNIIRYMSERFSKSFDDDDDYEKWADNVMITYLESSDDEDVESKYQMIPVNNDCYQDVDDIVRLEKYAKKNGYNTFILIKNVLFEKPKK